MTTAQARAGGKFLGNTPTLAIVESINAAFIAIRRNHPELPNAAIVVGVSGRKKNATVHGHFSPERWDGKSTIHEIMLAGESLERGAEATLGTLIHECAHLLAHARGIKDTSRQGRFHNKRFRELAIELGIHVEQDPTIGWSITSLPDTTAARYKTELSTMRKALKYYRKPESVATAVSRTVRVDCLCRGITLLKSFLDKGDLRCENCGEVFA